MFAYVHTQHRTMYMQCMITAELQLVYICHTKTMDDDRHVGARCLHFHRLMDKIGEKRQTCLDMTQVASVLTTAMVLQA